MKQLRILYRIWRAWRLVPELRLGQLIVNSTYCDMFYVGDAGLVGAIEDFAQLQSCSPR